MKAYLILEDGTVFEGTSIGSSREVISEIVFNTSMTGYLEVLTDPSYAGQAVVMTYPLIGNYGICRGSSREVISEIVFNTSMTGYLEVLTDPSYAGQAVVMTYPLIGNYGICRESSREVISEIVFNTSMTGYLEVLTDPSYAGQAVVMTYPLIGNYGICREDMESRQAWPDGYIVRELSRIPSNFRSGDTIDHFLKEQDIPGISGIDTRALTKILREKGTMNGMITTNGDYDLEEVKEKIRQYTVKGVVLKTSVKKPYVLPGDGKKVALLDCGAKDNIARNLNKRGCEVTVYPADTPAEEILKTYVLPGDGKKVALLDCGAKDNIARNLNKRGCEVTVYPADTPAEEILKTNPDGIMLSNGPGDPAENVGIIEEVRKLYESSVPIFAICLGHQLMALATGAKTYKLKYGHRGGNHPVKDLETGRVYITSQNHGYAVDEESLDPSVAVPAFVNVNDKTNEGLKYVGKNIFTVQYHPEACPGPLDSGYLFDRFMRMMEEGR